VQGSGGPVGIAHIEHLAKTPHSQRERGREVVGSGGVDVPHRRRAGREEAPGAPLQPPPIAMCPHPAPLRDDGGDPGAHSLVRGQTSPELAELEVGVGVHEPGSHNDVPEVEEGASAGCASPRHRAGAHQDSPDPPPVDQHPPADQPPLGGGENEAGGQDRHGQHASGGRRSFVSPAGRGW